MKGFRVQNKLDIFVLGVLVFFMGLFPGRVFAGEVSLPIRDISALVGESLVYDIGFLWFDQLAEAHLSFQRGDKKGIFKAALEARTLGVAAWLTGYRRQKYVSTMELGEKGRFRTLKYESMKIKGKGGKTRIWKKSYVFDYIEKKIDYIRFSDGKETKRKSFVMTGENPPADILTTLYNFRRGVYGGTMTQEPLILPTFARGGNSDIMIEIALPASKSGRDFFKSCRPLLKVTVDADVFDTGGGNVYACLDSNGRPWRGIVENVLDLGDVRGYTRKIDAPAP
jgi:hypothetical protein